MIKVGSLLTEQEKMSFMMPMTDRSCVPMLTAHFIVSRQQVLAATLQWFTAGRAIRIALRQLSQTCKLCHYDVIDVITRKL